MIGPREEVLPVGCVRVAAVVLAPGELAIEQAFVDGLHLLLSDFVRRDQGYPA